MARRSAFDEAEKKVSQLENRARTWFTDRVPESDRADFAEWIEDYMHAVKNLHTAQVAQLADLFESQYRDRVTKTLALHDMRIQALESAIAALQRDTP